MFISKLESFDQTKDLINITTYWKIIHANMTTITFTIKDKKWNNFIFFKSYY